MAVREVLDRAGAKPGATMDGGLLVLCVLYYRTSSRDPGCGLADVGTPSRCSSRHALGEPQTQEAGSTPALPPAPMNLAFGHKLGKQKCLDISVSMETRLKSVYVIGSSGSGKS